MSPRPKQCPALTAPIAGTMSCTHGSYSDTWEQGPGSHRMHARDGVDLMLAQASQTLKPRQVSKKHDGLWRETYSKVESSGHTAQPLGVSSCLFFTWEELSFVVASCELL